MSEKKELNQEQLEKVTGGDWMDKMTKYLPSTHGQPVGFSDARNYMYRDFYVVNDNDSQIFYWGTLNYVKDDGYTVYIKGHNNYNLCNCWDGMSMPLKANEYTLFLFN